jgi:uncharacterized glyoxalase superfamily protein PhnB
MDITGARHRGPAFTTHHMMKKPAGHHTVIPYLIVPDAPALIEFTRTVFGAVEIAKHLDEQGQIRHGEVKIDDTSIMFGNSTPEWAPQAAGLYIYVSDADRSYAAALAAGATSVMPPADQDYGRSCGVKDTNGNTWWITSAPGP